jgi:hypothetical protein
VSAFLLSLAWVAGALALASAAGLVASFGLLPRSPAFSAERAGWSFAVGCSLIAASVPVGLALGVKPGWLPYLLLAAAAMAAARLLPSPPLPAGEGNGEGKAGAGAPNGRRRWISRVLLGATLLGALLFLLRAVTEPMWSNDFLAIWGLKGKTIFFSRSVPSRLYDWPPLSFSHPEYPLGLPLLLSGLSFLTGRWDDHAMALLFPGLQVATLGVLYGWLRRRGSPREVALSAGAIVALFSPLYSAFLTGMAEIPLAFGLLLFGASLADSLEATDAGALRRLVLASALVAVTKNEGLFLAAAGFGIAALSGGARRLRVGCAALLPALAVYGLHVAWRGRAPLQDFDFALLSLARAGEAVGAAARVPGIAGWFGLAAVAVLVAAGRRDLAGDRLLLLCALGLAAYLALPVFAVRGPAWLVETTLARTAAALGPLAAAAIVSRLGARIRASAQEKQP